MPHMHMRRCIQQALLAKPNCPLCRASVRSPDLQEVPATLTAPATDGAAAEAGAAAGDGTGAGAVLSAKLRALVAQLLANRAQGADVGSQGAGAGGAVGSQLAGAGGVTVSQGPGAGGVAVSQMPGAGGVGSQGGASSSQGVLGSPRGRSGAAFKSVVFSQFLGETRVRWPGGRGQEVGLPGQGQRGRKGTGKAGSEQEIEGRLTQRRGSRGGVCRKVLFRP